MTGISVKQANSFKSIVDACPFLCLMSVRIIGIKAGMSRMKDEDGRRCLPALEDIKEGSAGNGCYV